MKNILEFLHPKIWIIKVFTGDWYEGSYILSYHIIPFRLKKIKLKYLTTLRKEAFKECPVDYIIEDIYENEMNYSRLIPSFYYVVNFYKLSEKELNLYDKWKNHRDGYLENPKVIIYKEKLKL